MKLATLVKGGVALGALVGVCGGVVVTTDLFTVDLRPEEWASFHKLEQSGRDIVREAAKVHGRNAWVGARKRRVPLELEVAFHPLAFTLPLIGPVALVLEDAGSPSPVYTTVDKGGAQVQLVLEDGVGWLVTPEKRDPGPAGTTWMATALRRFLALPLELPDSAIQEYVARRELYGRPHDVVFVTWADSLALDRGADQYLVWIDQETHRVTRVDATSRDVGRAAQLLVEYAYPSRPERVQTPSEVRITDLSWVDMDLLTLRADTVELR